MERDLTKVDFVLELIYRRLMMPSGDDYFVQAHLVFVSDLIQALADIISHVLRDTFAFRVVSFMFPF